LLPGRTRWAVQQRANRLGIAGEKSDPERISAQQRVDLQWLYLSGWSVRAAAEQVGIRSIDRAHDIIDAAKAELRRYGTRLPQRLNRADRKHSAPAATPSATVIAHDAPPPPPSIAIPEPEQRRPQLPIMTAKPQPARRPLSLEEQLARIAAGAQLVPTFRPTRPLIDATLGGVGSGLL
jgi:hypothetical protein